MSNAAYDAAAASFTLAAREVMPKTRPPVAISSPASFLSVPAWNTTVLGWALASSTPLITEPLG
eukprot:CAMPEP_0114230502 /NCGR_PEP_ID=MMETSP0058-20121206/3507_1 /TAXON_ID=36894 /ORGANISM="Pyramimonas parkeae, CCMP726" /LENGTH=63 /DNA_ID=CAMNT_0001341713 /DNA_START=342 /DNA_END=533 /DNA_ORIENTATION=-